MVFNIEMPYNLVNAGFKIFNNADIESTQQYIENTIRGQITSKPKGKYIIKDMLFAKSD